MARSKAYGGAGGHIFIKRRKPPPTIDTTATTTTTTTKPHTNISRSVTPSPTNIGWDEIKCRPIFEGAPVSNSEESDDDFDDRMEHNDDDDKKSLVVEVTPKEEDQWIGETAGRKKKTYGNRRKCEVFFPETTRPVVVAKSFGAKTAVSKKKALPPSPESTKDCRPSFPFASPAPVNGSICDALNSARKPTASATAECCDKEHNESLRGKKESSTTMLKKRKRSAQAKERGNPRGFEFTDDKQQQQQPNSSTSVSNAKAFFDHLDANHELQVVCQNNVDHATPQPRKRAYRSINKPNMEDLKEEYQAYSKASHESGVVPISIEDYNMNRSQFYRPNEMFDGFLE